MDHSSTSNHHDFDQYIERLLQGNKLNETEVLHLCEKAKEVLSQEPNIRYVNSPVTICGNLNGQFEDLLELFHVAGKIHETNYLFLGNYAHLGWNGVSTLSLLLAYKVRYQDRITLLRGMAENREMEYRYGFYDECLRAYGGSHVFQAFIDVFEYLPLAAVVENTLFCVHSGLSREINSLDGINKLNRVQAVPYEGPIHDMLLSQPGEAEGWHMIPKSSGYYFPKEFTRKFNHQNNLKMICRGQHYLKEGYSFAHDGLVVSLCSAPNCLGRLRNQGAFLERDDSFNMNYVTFEAAPKSFKENSKGTPEHFVCKELPIKDERDSGA